MFCLVINNTIQYSTHATTPSGITNKSSVRIKHPLLASLKWVILNVTMIMLHVSLISKSNNEGYRCCAWNRSAIIIVNISSFRIIENYWTSNKSKIGLSFNVLTESISGTKLNINLLQWRWTLVSKRAIISIKHIRYKIKS